VTPEKLLGERERTLADRDATTSSSRSHWAANGPEWTI
jgi:hypothetical protein